jgi:hypothetical protein|tara:strand:+ start:78 stop:314 length:237 start_codon:yes stop_codon:yes gene_type:complete
MEIEGGRGGRGKRQTHRRIKEQRQTNEKKKKNTPSLGMEKKTTTRWRKSRHLAFVVRCAVFIRRGKFCTREKKVDIRG